MKTLSATVGRHLLGGVPVGEVEAACSLLASHGFSPDDGADALLQLRASLDYYDFAPHLKARGDLKRLVEQSPGVRGVEKLSSTVL